MVVPAFSDISKPTKDILNKDFYHLANAALEVKTKAPNGVAFTARGRNSGPGVIDGSIEAKYADKASGLALTQSWSTKNVLDSKVELSDALTPGLKTELATSYFPATANRAAKVAVYFSQPSLHARGFFDLLKGPSFVGDVTVGHDGFLAGGEIGYDVLKGRISRYSAAIGYASPLYTASVTATDSLSVFSAAYYHKVSDLVEIGSKATWDSKTAAPAVGLELATKYKLDKDAFAKAKLNDKGIAAIAYSQSLRPGVRLGLGLQIDTQRLNEPVHKLGASLTFEN